MRSGETTASTKPNKILDVLKFWHSIEFFTPYNLDEVLSRSNITYKLTAEQLQQQADSCLPWLSKEALRQAGGNPHKEHRFTLYLLPFAKNRLTQVSRQIFSAQADEIKRIEYEEKLNDEGETCFAKITLNSHGQPLFDKLSISTMPWALGKLQDKNFAALNSACFQAERSSLLGEINDLFSNQHQQGFANQPTVDLVRALKAETIIDLCNLLLAWSQWKDNISASVMLEIYEVQTKENTTSKTSPSAAAHNHKKLAAESGASLVNAGDLTAEEAEDDDEKDEPVEELAILNSFYIEELEQIINDANSTQNRIIHDYIAGISTNQKIDLYTPENQSVILQKLQPNCLTQGRWPSDAKHFMSLMQQFAINACWSNTGPLFSVNGPPGTGKTTLLQEIIAENSVRRARVLAGYTNASQAFTGKLTVKFANRESCTISLLDPSLTGFEVVVLSSNNAAVENISKELPLKAKLPEPYQSYCRFLEPVANKLFAKHKADRIEPVMPRQKPWGLISVALGNSKNRSRFVNDVFFPPKESKLEQERLQQGEYLTIWEWCRQYNGLSFNAAKIKFIAAEQALKAYLAQTYLLVHYYETVHNNDHKIKAAKERIEELSAAQKTLPEKIDELQAELEPLIKEEAQCKEDLKQQRRYKPGFIARLLGKPSAVAYQNVITELQTHYRDIFKQKKTKQDQLKTAQASLLQHKRESEALRSKIAVLEKERAANGQNYTTLLEQLPGIILPPIDNNIEHPDVQKQAFWQSEQLNQLRSELFITALNLHEAWLAEACNNKHEFKGNLIAISKLLTANKPVDPAVELPIWQSLFMLVPVISSTFASFGGQFKNLPAQSLGWVLIDEAGQAIPQAAAGALWRAKNALIVGDPLQIEPVFTTPPELVEGFAKRLLHESYDQWLPTTASVQRLADDANQLGAYTSVTGAPFWIGCPLRVHRRCSEPMFSVSNAIAYGNKMLQAKIIKAQASHCLLGPSCWFDIPGEASDKQYVVEQGLVVLHLLAKLYIHEQKLPDLYVIAPFKQIKHKLHLLIQDLQHWAEFLPAGCKLPAKSSLQQWVQRHIGTIHTFQGKEAKTVFLVLGTDAKNQGAANWASSKPNLLNVALTRAKDNIYLIGDYALWGNKTYFCELTGRLPIRKIVIERTANSLDKTSYLDKALAGMLQSDQLA